MSCHREDSDRPGSPLCSAWSRVLQLAAPGARCPPVFVFRRVGWPERHSLPPVGVGFVPSGAFRALRVLSRPEGSWWPALTRVPWSGCPSPPERRLGGRPAVAVDPDGGCEHPCARAFPAPLGGRQRSTVAGMFSPCQVLERGRGCPGRRAGEPSASPGCPAGSTHPRGDAHPCVSPEPS